VADFAYKTDRKNIEIFKLDIKYNKSKFLNCGLAHIYKNRKNKWVLISDADMVYDKFFWEQLKKIKAESIKNCYQFVIHRLDIKSTQAIQSEINNTNNIIGKYVGRTHAPRNPMMFNVDFIINNIGGYDERFDGWGAEDDDLISRIERSEGCFKRLNHIVYHLNHDDITRVNKKYKSLAGQNLKLWSENNKIKLKKISNSFM